MPSLSGIYDSAWIQPIAKIKENLSIWTQGSWSHYVINYLEPVPPGPASTVEMVTASGAAWLLPYATIAKQVVAILQPNELEFMHLRWEPLDNVEGVLWEQAGQAKFNVRNFHARVDLNTKLWDPHLVSTTFWILGMNRDMNLEVRNPMPVVIPMARFRFWGYRYLLSLFDATALTAPDRAKLAQGDIETVRKHVGPTAWIPAEGRGG